MGETFQKDSAQVHALWFFPFASLVLRFERLLSPADLRRYRCGTATTSNTSREDGDDRHVEIHIGEIEAVRKGSSSSSSSANNVCRSLTSEFRVLAECLQRDLQATRAVLSAEKVNLSQRIAAVKEGHWS